MTSKRANWLFLTIILAHIGVVLFLIFGAADISFGIVANFFLSEGILMVPALAFLLIFERRERQPGLQMPMPEARQTPIPGMQPMPGVPTVPRAPFRFEAAAFHRIKISTLLMIALCTFLVMPLVTVLNTLTMFFTDNAVAALQGDIVSTPFPVMLFMIGIFGPFCEEFVFRGVIYRSYRRNSAYINNTGYAEARGNGILAILLSAFLFGLMHMNFNQALYAFGIGIFLALLVEAAGSLWASVFCHMFFNSWQVVLMYVSGSILNSEHGRAVSEAVELTTQDLMVALSVYLIIAAVTTPIAVCIIVWITKNEGRQEIFRELFRRNGCVAGRRMPQQQSEPPRTDYLLSVPLIIAVVLCLGYMSLELFLGV